MIEQILVVPRSQIESHLHFHGFRQVQEDFLEILLQHNAFKPRDVMESDPSFKQIVPYLLLRHEDQVFRYWRTRKGGESRLHHLYSIGVGGHINQRDENLFSSGQQIFREAAMRELQEELECVQTPELTWIGIINDDETEVGKVHLGLVYEAHFDNPTVRLREQALGRGEWKRLGELKDGVEYETWSSFLIEEYLGK